MDYVETQLRDRLVLSPAPRDPRADEALFYASYGTAWPVFRRDGLRLPRWPRCPRWLAFWRVPRNTAPTTGGTRPEVPA